MISKKIVMIGAWGVGKTSLVRQYVDSVFSEKYHSTIGVKVDKKVLQVDEQELTMVLWDIAGAEEHFPVRLRNECACF
ncbi:MAG: small GTP-binding protein [Arenicella sp.]|jgi:small GTP-binding protein